jgi:selenium metabolism protein YedF
MSIIDMTGKPCPLPVIEAKKALRASAPGQTVTVLVDNDIARQNLEKMAKDLGHVPSSTAAPEGKIEVAIVAGNLKPASPESNEPGGLAVAIGQSVMGGGQDRTLGQTLLKAFIFSLGQLASPPEYVLFFNEGAFMTTEGSSSIDDLLALEKKGTVISTCGACLNYFDLTDKLKVGSVTNMAAIAETMAQAKTLINI